MGFALHHIMNGSFHESALVLSSTDYDIYSKDALLAELSVLEGRDCTIDMRNVRYIDSTCLGALVQTLNRLRRNDKDSTVTLINVSPMIRRVLDIANLTLIFKVP